MSSSWGELIRGPLRGARATLASAVAASVQRRPSLEPWLVRTGRSLARRSRFGGGLYWFVQESLIKRLQQGGNRYREVQIRNIPLVVDVTDPTGRYPYFYSKPYEKAVTDAIITALRPGDVFLDVGANIGYFTTLAARLVGKSGRVIAFEPHAGAHAALRANAERNHVEESVEIVPMALAEREADFTLYTTDEFTSYSTLEPDLSPMRSVAAFHPATVIHATTMDGWLAGRPDIATRVRCIKIDVEGAEARVVAGMQQSLQPSGVTVICETTIGSDADVALQRAGFRRHRIERGTLSYGNFLYVKPDVIGS
jgi:FkbM family methyltransferase